MRVAELLGCEVAQSAISQQQLSNYSNQATAYSWLAGCS